ncbi:MAG TPA: hypothetical protein VJT81_10390 [Burkholderiales bacterium]|nr:hypothetical protein [Burkholderiales bacterium]
MWFLASMLTAPSVHAQQAQPRFVQDRGELVNWYYAATFGTGVYTSGDRTVAVVQLPLSYTLRVPEEDRWGLRVTLPVSVGFYDYHFDDIFNQGLPDGLSTMSFMPGLELEKQITSRWRLKPYVSAGAGWELDGAEHAWIYDAGLRSRFVLGEDKGVEFALVNRLSLAGYSVHNESSHPLSYLAIGMDIVVPTGAELFERNIIISLTPAYYHYFRHLRFAEFSDADNSIGEEFEFAISVLTRRPFSIFGIEVDRIGLAVRNGEGVTGYRLFTSLPF